MPLDCFRNVSPTLWNSVSSMPVNPFSCIESRCRCLALRSPILSNVIPKSPVSLFKVPSIPEAKEPKFFLDCMKVPSSMVPVFPIAAPTLRR